MANGMNLQREIASLEQALDDAVKETGNAERALDELEGRRNEAAGRVEIARQAATNYAARLEERRQALAQARLLEAVGARDDAANRAAEAIAHLIASFERLDAARAATAERVEETESHSGRRAEVGPEPVELEQEWTRLIDFVSKRAQLRLDDELVEAAASSPSGFEINKLPQELRVIARRRRTELFRRASSARNQRDS